ncbi:hypothetical protein PTKIN_Ptkin11bG0083800 [Pterospermum kingtungense]
MTLLIHQIGIKFNKNNPNQLRIKIISYNFTPIITHDILTLVHPNCNSNNAPRNADSEEIINFVVDKGNGIKGLVDTGIGSVPELYILLVDRLEVNKVVSKESIPVIDVSNWDDPKVAESICKAASKWGFFEIINHGVPLEVLSNVKEAGHRFFGLPNEERKKYQIGHSPTDTVALKTSFVPQAEAVLEWIDYSAFGSSGGIHEEGRTCHQEAPGGLIEGNQGE